MCDSGCSELECISTDPPYILCVVVEKNLYKLGTKHGSVKGRYGSIEVNAWENVNDF